MRIGIEHMSIVVRSWPSKQEFLHFIKRSTTALDLDVQIQQEDEFYTLTLLSEPDGKELWTVGVRSEDHGVLPEAIMFPSTQHLVIGANTEIYFLSWASKTVTKTVSLSFLFRSFIVNPEHSLILAVHETGMTALSLEGCKLWELSRDVVETVEVSGDRIQICFMGAEPVSLRMDTGQEVHV
jgi:hypothetical protein